MKNHKKEVHRHYTVQAIALMVIVCLFAACVNRIDDEEMLDEKGHLSVKTRTGSIPLPYPVHIYAFDAEGKQAAVSTMKSADDDCSLTLAKGSYHLVALAGTEGVSLPESPTKTSSITLPASNYSTSALMMGSADVTLSSADAETNITLSYRVARIELSLRDIPAAVTTVKVSFSPLYNALSFEGIGAGEGNKATITCAKDGTLWKAPLFYTFRGSGQSLTLSIEMTDAGGTKTYGYTYQGRLEAGFPYLLSGSYQQGFSVNGSITAEGWGEAKNIGFTFGGGNTDTGGNTDGGTGGETPDPGKDDTYTVAAIPAAGTLWNGHAVVAVQNATATSANLLLLSLKEWKDVASANSAKNPMEAATLATAYSEGGMVGWRIPTKDEANLIEKQCGGIVLISDFNDLLTEAGGDVLTGDGKDNHREGVRYLCEDATSTYDLKTTSGDNTQAGEIRTYYLRAVKTVHVTTAH